VFRDWLARSPDDPQAHHHLAAVTGDGVPDRASDNYVADLFDGFARSFDAKLASLDYRAPALCEETVRRRLGPPAGDLRVLDAGCGTGLCGPLLRPYARELWGVDLSGGMLDRARVRAIHDVLEQGELGAWLAVDRAPFDLIISADTLCYFGALDTLLAAMRRASADGGWLVFTVEALDEALTAECRLLPHGRYAHRREAVERWLEVSDWAAIEMEQVVLRQEAGAPVRGWLASARAVPRD
jgi:predicted TPR repeat methyltransferase